MQENKHKEPITNWTGTRQPPHLCTDTDEKVLQERETGRAWKRQCKSCLLSQ